MVSMTFYFRWDDTEQELDRELIRSEATKELWMMRIDEPMPDRGIWEWEDENGDKIGNITDYLSIFRVNPIPGADVEEYPYIAYFYKEQPKKPGAKAYTTVWPKVYKSTDENKGKLKKDIDWLKSKGYLKELTDEVNNAPTMNEGGLANL